MRHKHKKRWGKIYLDKENAWISGVCAGLARHFDVEVKWIRLGWVIGLFAWFPIFALAYLAMAFFHDPLPTDEDDLQADLKAMEEAAKPARPGTARRKFAMASERYEKLETRLQALESVVTSKAFQMDRELGRSEDGMDFHVYIVSSPARDALAMGVTNNIAHCLEEQDCRNGRLVYFETYDGMERAQARATALRRDGAEQTQALVTNLNPDWDDLYPSAAAGS